LAAGRIDEEAFAQLLTGTLPQLIDGEHGREWTGGHDRIDYGLLERALADVPAGQAAAVREACARGERLRVAIDATPSPRPDAECSPGRGHVHHDACRCDGTRKTTPGWEYQFLAALGHLRTAWTALAGVERTTAATRTAQTIRQIRNLLRRLGHAGHAGVRGAPLVIMDAGYSAAALTSALRVRVEHLPDGRKPHKTMWLWHAGPALLSLDELWRAYLARFDIEEHTFKFLKGVLGLTAAKV